MPIQPQLTQVKITWYERPILQLEVYTRLWAWAEVAQPWEEPLLRLYPKLISNPEWGIQSEQITQKPHINSQLQHHR